MNNSEIKLNLKPEQELIKRIITEFCEKKKLITNLYIQNDVVYITLNNNINVKIKKEALKQLKREWIDAYKTISKVYIKGIKSNNEIISFFKNKNGELENDYLLIGCSYLSYLLSIHHMELMNTMYDIKLALNWKIPINYNSNKQEVTYE